MIPAVILKCTSHLQVTSRYLATASPSSVTTQCGLNARRAARPFSEIPGPFRIPVWGNLLWYKSGFYDWSDYHRLLCRLKEKFGPIVREDLGPSTIIHIFHPDDAKSIYAAEGPTPFIHPLQEAVKLYRKHQDLSPGLGNTNGEDWYRLRRGVRRFMLQPREVHQYLPEVDAATDLLINRILSRRNDRGEVVTLNEDVGKWSQESAGRICFGRSLGCLSGREQESLMDDIIRWNRSMFRISAHLKFSLPFYKIFPTPRWVKFAKLEQKLVDYSTKNVEITLTEIKHLVENNEPVPERLSFMRHLLASEGLNDKDVVVLALSLFLDGLSTTVPTALFNLYNLAIHPQVQEQAFDEVRQALPDPRMPVTPSTLGKLSFIKAVVKETFRTIPNGTDISRVLEKDHVLSGFHVPAGTHININMIANFQSEEFFSSPEKFMPERWLRGGETERIHPFVLTPFGHGIRTCAGRRFAEQDLYVLLAKVVRRFRLGFPKDEKMETVFHTLIFPKSPVPILFEERQQR